MASDPSDPNSCKVFKDVAVIGLVGLKDVIAVSSSSKVGLAAMLSIYYLSQGLLDSTTGI
jgi:hypothetical protein